MSWSLNLILRIWIYGLKLPFLGSIRIVRFVYCTHPWRILQIIFHLVPPFFVSLTHCFFFFTNAKGATIVSISSKDEDSPCPKGGILDTFFLATWLIGSLEIWNSIITLNFMCCFLSDRLVEELKVKQIILLLLHPLYVVRSHWDHEVFQYCFTFTHSV